MCVLNKYMFYIYIINYKYFVYTAYVQQNDTLNHPMPAVSGGGFMARSGDPWLDLPFLPPGAGEARVDIT